jgi:outer membrane protein W
LRNPLVRTTVVLALAVAASSAATPARAESALGANLGYSKTVDGQGQFTGGAQLRLKFLPLFGFELLAGYRKDSVEAKGETVLEVEQIPIQASVMLYPLTIGPVRIYALGGGGAYITRSSGVNGFASYGKVTSTNFGAHAGAGTDVRFGGPFFLSGDVRYIWLNIDSFSDVEQAFNEKRSADYWVGTVMINFRF